MHITDSAYIAVLENKLIQAERSIYEFRQIFTHWTGRSSGEEEGNKRPRLLTRLEDGSYPGQLPPLPIEDNECLE